jgi:hypothetical protein
MNGREKRRSSLRALLALLVLGVKKRADARYVAGACAARELQMQALARCGVCAVAAHLAQVQNQLGALWARPEALEAAARWCVGSACACVHGVSNELLHACSALAS